MIRLRADVKAELSLYCTHMSFTVVRGPATSLDIIEIAVSCENVSLLVCHVVDVGLKYRGHAVHDMYTHGNYAMVAPLHGNPAAN